MADVILKGSERVALAQSRVLGPADPSERLEVSVLVRRRAAEVLRARAAALASGNRSVGHLTRESFAEQHGAEAPDLAAVRAFAAVHGLAVVSEHAARRTVVLAGTVAQFSAAFSVELKRYEHPTGTYRGRTGPIHLPQQLAGVVVAVLGLDDRQQARPHFRLRPPRSRADARSRSGTTGTFSPIQVAALYGFPGGTGKGQCVAIIELGGGFRPADLKTYFGRLKVGSPNVIAVSVDHGRNAPTGDPGGADGEVMLDVEVVGSIVPAATIAVYFAPNTDAGFLDAVTSAIHDAANKPSVISISWGSAESTWTAQTMNAMDEAFESAASLGISICVASGDDGSSDGVSDGKDHVDFPASSPFALACGGTSLKASGGAISSEVAWNDGAGGGATGGGISAYFAAPGWQSGLSATRSGSGSTRLSNRGVPDVAGNADPQTGYQVRIDGSDEVIGGTSAVAPLWAALIARLNQSAGAPVGYINPTLYREPQALRDIVQGNNGDFRAATGWDACTGLGSPNGKLLAGASRPNTTKRK